MTSDPGDEYDREAEQFMSQFREFATKNFGVRCDDYEPECACCKLWNLVEQTAKVVII